MATQITTTDTATQSLATRLMSCLPAWVSARDLDAEQFFMPSVPRGQGDGLRQIVAEYRGAMQPATYDQRKGILRELRLSTVARNESEVEARASFEKLVADLADVPADILRDACRAYTNEPGTRFFPRGAGELRAFTNPLMAQRAVRAHRLNEMAKASDDAFDETTRCTPEQAAAIKAELGLEMLGITPQSQEQLNIPRASEAVAHVENAPDITGLSISEIFAQRDRLRARAMQDWAA